MVGGKTSRKLGNQTGNWWARVWGVWVGGRMSGKWLQGSPFTGISAFHRQLVNDALWVIFHLLPVEEDPVSVRPISCKIWGRGPSLKLSQEVDIYLEWESKYNKLMETWRFRSFLLRHKATLLHRNTCWLLLAFLPHLLTLCISQQLPAVSGAGSSKCPEAYSSLTSHENTLAVSKGNTVDLVT